MSFLAAVGRLCYYAYLLDIGRVIAASGEGSRDAQAHLMVISPCHKSYNQIFTIYWSLNLPQWDLQVSKSHIKAYSTI